MVCVRVRVVCGCVGVVCVCGVCVCVCRNVWKRDGKADGLFIRDVGPDGWCVLWWSGDLRTDLTTHANAEMPKSRMCNCTRIF